MADAGKDRDMRPNAAAARAARSLIAVLAACMYRRERVAQSVEHLTFNQTAAGSSPAALTTVLGTTVPVQFRPQAGCLGRRIGVLARCLGRSLFYRRRRCLGSSDGVGLREGQLDLDP